MKPWNGALLLISLTALAGCWSNSSVSESTPQLSVLESMVAVVAPATDTIWDAYNLETDAQWQIIDDAAIKTVRAFNEIKSGGSGVNDTRWAEDPQWKAYSDEVIKAAEMVREAVSKRDEDLLADAGEKLYPPCESCHVQFQPGGDIQ